MTDKPVVNAHQRSSVQSLVANAYSHQKPATCKRRKSTYNWLKITKNVKWSQSGNFSVSSTYTQCDLASANRSCSASRVQQTPAVFVCHCHLALCSTDGTDTWLCRVYPDRDFQDWRYKSTWPMVWKLAEKTRVSGISVNENRMILGSLVLIHYQPATDS